MRELTALEIRVIGTLIEKQVTTPDQYPLSLNALVNACNQKSNREPVLNLTEAEVRDIVNALQEINLVAEMSIGSRVSKYKHRFCNTEFSSMHLAPPELAIMCLLFLRGPQTPGELRSRSGRLHTFASVTNVETCLQELIDREPDPLVCKLDREPGRRESRYMHLLCGEVELVSPPSPSTAPPVGTNTDQLARIALLEEQVAKLQKDIEVLQQQWDDLNN